MGNRASVSFKKGKDESIALFSHWGGMDFVKQAKNYAKELKKTEGTGTDPLGRLEPHTVMVDFIRELTQDMRRVRSDLYLGKDENDGDSSDNGHHVINLD